MHGNQSGIFCLTLHLEISLTLLDLLAGLPTPDLLNCVLKGTVQRKLTGVVSYTNQEVFYSHLTADILFLKIKRTSSLNRKKPVSAA